MAHKHLISDFIVCALDSTIVIALCSVHLEHAMAIEKCITGLETVALFFNVSLDMCWEFWLDIFWRDVSMLAGPISDCWTVLFYRIGFL